jgi:hypothetical protein
MRLAIIGVENNPSTELNHGISNNVHPQQAAMMGKAFQKHGTGEHTDVQKYTKSVTFCVHRVTVTSL